MLLKRGTWTVTLRLRASGSGQFFLNGVHLGPTFYIRDWGRNRGPEKEYRCSCTIDVVSSGPVTLQCMNRSRRKNKMFRIYELEMTCDLLP